MTGDLDQGRLAIRLSIAFSLSIMRLGLGVAQGDLTRALIKLALVSCNTEHLNLPTPDGTAPNMAIDDVVPDDLRRPVSVLALARETGLPKETVRRHVNQMIRTGQCIRTIEGVYVPAAALVDDKHKAAMAASLVALKKFMKTVAAAGIHGD